MAREQAGDLRSALSKLAPREREVIELRLAGLSSAENALDEIAGRVIRAHEQAAVNGAGSHFDQVACWEIAQWPHDA